MIKYRIISRQHIERPYAVQEKRKFLFISYWKTIYYHNSLDIIDEDIADRIKSDQQLEIAIKNMVKAGTIIKEYTDDERVIMKLQGKI